jgi:hypothetical protein
MRWELEASNLQQEHARERLAASSAGGGRRSGRRGRRRLCGPDVTGDGAGMRPAGVGAGAAGRVGAGSGRWRWCGSGRRSRCGSGQQHRCGSGRRRRCGSGRRHRVHERPTARRCGMRPAASVRDAGGDGDARRGRRQWCGRRDLAFAGA